MAPVGDLVVTFDFSIFEKIAKVLGNIGAPEEIRTPNLLIRSQMLYPVELRARTVRKPHGRAKGVKPLAPICGFYKILRPRASPFCGFLRPRRGWHGRDGAGSAVPPRRSLISLWQYKVPIYGPCRHRRDKKDRICPEAADSILNIFKNLV
jgi:hypothetical protein